MTDRNDGTTGKKSFSRLRTKEGVDVSTMETRFVIGELGRDGKVR